jgi:hypothetical protein
MKHGSHVASVAQPTHHEAVSPEYLHSIQFDLISERFR